MSKYPSTHQRLRLALVPLVRAGAFSCWRCGEAIAPDAKWDLGHDDLDPSQYRGPEHQRCNRATKGRNPNALPQVAKAPSGRISPRACEICGDQYTPTFNKQRTCGRACGTELRLRNHPPAGRKPRAPKPRQMWCAIRFVTCERCEVLFAAKTKAKRFCSDRCMRGLPEVHQCGECGVTIERSRHKCDPCIAATKRERKRRERRSEAGRRRSRESKRRREQRKREERRSHLGGPVADAQAA